MPLHHAVLALLSAKPAHGYELKTSFEQAVGDQWGGLNIGHLYQILDRLSRDGLIDSQRQPQQVKPDRVIHRLTRPAAPSSTAGSPSPPSPPAATATTSSSRSWPPPAPPTPPRFPPCSAGSAPTCCGNCTPSPSARATTPATAVESLLITAAELHIRADLGVVDAAEKTLATEPPPPSASRHRRA